MGVWAHRAFVIMPMVAMPPMFVPDDCHKLGPIP